MNMSAVNTKIRSTMLCLSGLTYSCWVPLNSATILRIDWKILFSVKRITGIKN